MQNPYKVKICGTTSVTDAQMAADAGVDFSGIVVEAAFSERSVTVDQAAEIAQQTPIPTVALVFDRSTDWVQHAAEQIEPFALQLLGHETPTEVEQLKQLTSCEIWKSLFLPIGSSPQVDVNLMLDKMKAHIDAGADALLFDTADFSSGKARFGGTGRTSDWQVAAQLIDTCEIPAFLSGGIRPDNVKEAIEAVGPYGIDLCSGVESTKGVRDFRKLNRLMQEVEAASRP